VGAVHDFRREAEILERHAGNYSAFRNAQRWIEQSCLSGSDLDAKLGGEAANE
jgi:hypothetical protein